MNGNEKKGGEHLHFLRVLKAEETSFLTPSVLPSKAIPTKA